YVSALLCSFSGPTGSPRALPPFPTRRSSDLPDRLAGSDIPFAARLLALADAFDVMTNDRPYSRARSVEEARREVAAHRGTQFCPQCVDAFMSIEPSALEAVRRGELDRSLIFDDPDLQPGGLLKRQDSLPA